MTLLRWTGRVIAGAWRLAAAAFNGVVTLFGASLDAAVSLVARLYDRFDAGFSNLAAQSRRRKGVGAYIAAPGE